MAKTDGFFPSAVTTALVQQLLDRDAHGQRKYGTSMDRGDLTPEEWAQHGVEEMLDAAGYLTALKRELAIMREEIDEARKLRARMTLLREDVNEPVARGLAREIAQMWGEDRTNFEDKLKDKVFEIMAIALDYERSNEDAKVHELFSEPDNGPDIPDWYDRPFARFTRYIDMGDDSVGIGSQYFWALAQDQSGTVVGDMIKKHEDEG